ncbi:hypothetical protein JVT61DRAFT_6743 [Boletus reticuloceps]|uniref:Uncharacterized protein n=1 Tax=Boletus reticuloceps TaxID=495285 RepID=A0A8I2YJ94_9AGAM|nr:hypothetical protein JVT61DRAFT_6743 [Boletus reticuloceps]
MPPHRVRARPTTPSDQPDDSSPMGDHPIVDEDLADIPTISWNVEAQSSPHPPLSTASAAAVMASSPPTPDPAGQVDLVHAAALMENIPGVTLVPPSDEEVASHALLTPPPHNPPHRLRLGGSSPSTPPKKRLDKGKGRAGDLPANLAGLPGPHPTIRIPPRPPSPSKEPLPSANWIYCLAVLMAASRGLDLKDPTVHTHVLRKLTELAPGVDFTDLLEQGAHTLIPLDLPNPDQRALLPAFSTAPSTSAPRSLPMNPVILDGFDLPCPAKVISALKNNWTVHVPITALTTRTIAATSFVS